MQDGVTVFQPVASETPAPAVRSGVSLIWPALACLSLALAAGAVAARLLMGHRFDGLLIFSALLAVVVLGLRVLVRDPMPAETVAVPVAEPLRDLFDSAGPAVVAIDLHGRLTYVNPSAERLLGYHADELMKEWASFQILGPGEGSRLIGEMQRICGDEKPLPPTQAGRLAAYLDCVRSLPPSHVPSFDAQLRHRDGELIPITLHTSALRDRSGAVAGLVAVAIDQSATLRHDQAQRESQERYRDLFENSSEMIATLSPRRSFSMPIRRGSAIRSRSLRAPRRKFL